jgi:hypothetical protein
MFAGGAGTIGLVGPEQEVAVRTAAESVWLYKLTPGG